MKKLSATSYLLAIVRKYQSRQLSPSQWAELIESDYKKFKLKKSCAKFCADALWNLWQTGKIKAYDDSTYGRK